MSFSEFFIFIGALSIPVMMMLVHDYRIARQNGVKLIALTACFNRYSTLIVLTAIYDGTFYLLLYLYTSGYLDNGQSLNLYDRHDFFVPTACISTLSMLLFGYILQADNCFYLNALMKESDPLSGKRDLIYRTFRSLSIGQIAPGILYPLSVSLWALQGAWLYNIYSIVMRAGNQDLMPRVFFSGAIRMIMALFVSILIYCVFQALFKPYAVTNDDNDRALVVDNGKAVYFLVALAFFSGVFPMQAAQATWQTIKSSEFVGEVFTPSSTLSMEHVQGMNALMRDRLFEEGIVDIHQLATIGKRRDLLYSRIENLVSKEQLNDWIDQAGLMLFVADGNLLQSLRSAGIRGKAQMDALISPDNSERLAQLLQSLTADKDAKVKRFIEQYSLTHAPAPQQAD